MAKVPTEQSPRPTIWKGPIDLQYLRDNPTCSVEQATTLLGVSREYGYQLIKSGKLGAVTLGARRYRVKSASLLKLLGED